MVKSSCQVIKLSNLQSCRAAGLPSCCSAELPGCRAAKLPNAGLQYAKPLACKLPICKLPSCRIYQIFKTLQSCPVAELRVAKLMRVTFVYRKCCMNAPWLVSEGCNLAAHPNKPTTTYFYTNYY
jgi:hypothetical protein